MGIRSTMALALRISRRLLALAAYGAALAALFFAVRPLLPQGEAGDVSTANAADTKAPARPASLPYRIPPWAWDLQAWLLKAPADRGPRPKAAPGHVPAWFWTWRTWRLAQASAS